MSGGRLTGRKALVTGGARGIGEAIATALVNAGASVMITDILSDLGKETAAKIGKSGVKTGFAELNVTDDAQWEKAVAATVSELGGYDICLETPGLDTLDILVFWKGFPTYASTQTIFTILKANWYYLEQNKFLEWDVTARADVVVPGQHETAIAVPWGGTAHPVWFKNDPRVANCRVMGGVLQRAVMEGVVQTTQMVKEQIKPLPPDQQEKALADIAATVQAAMPPRENPRINTSIDSVYASGPLGRAHCVIHGNCNYKQTGMLQAYAAYSLLQTPPRKVGFASGCQAFGHRELLGQLRSFGLVMNPILTVQA